MTDFISFNEGENAILVSGLPGTCHFLLSTEAVGTLTSTSTLSGGVGEITGTGYGRLSQALPTPVAGAISFSNMTWNTGSATDWPSSVKSVILATSADNSGHAICAWNLITGGGGRNLASAGAIESVTPTLTTESTSVPDFSSSVAVAGVTGAPTLSPTSGTPEILPTSLSMTDVGTNLVNNGTFKIYQVPSTGIYEIVCNFNFQLGLTGATAAGMFMGPAIGSSSAGTASISNQFMNEVEIVLATADPFAFSFTSYQSLTSGQFVNLAYQFGGAASAISFSPLNDATNLSIQRIA